MNEQELRRVLVRVVPRLPSPEDRVSAVIARAGRRQRNIVTVGAAVIVGIVVLGGVPLVRALAGRPLNVPPAMSNIPSASPTPRADGVLETPGCVGYHPDMATEYQGTPVAPNQMELSDLAERVQPPAMSRFPDVFSYVELRHENDRLRVWRKPSAEFDAWIVREFDNECLEIADAKASEKEIDEWSRQVDFRYWRNKGIDIYSVHGDAIEGVLVIGVAAEDLARARKEIPKKYPDIPIKVEKGVPVVLT